MKLSGIFVIFMFFWLMSGCAYIGGVKDQHMTTDTDHAISPEPSPSAAIETNENNPAASASKEISPVKN